MIGLVKCFNNFGLPSSHVAYKMFNRDLERDLLCSIDFILIVY